MASTVKVEDIKKYMNRSPESHDIKPASDWCEDVVNMIMNPKAEADGLPVHYLNYQEHLRFRLGEVSIWAGVNGHGKSMALSQFILAGLFTERFGTISPEMLPIRQMQRMTYQACRCRHPNPDQVRAFHQFTDGRLWIYDQQGRINLSMIYACARYMAHELGITHIIIDSMMKCVQREDDLNEQKGFVNSLCALAKELNIHVHLVCHSRKGSSEKAMPDKFDIKGSGTITDLVDNVLIVWRNKGKEMNLNKKNLSELDRRKLSDEPDSALVCVKQRHHDWEGQIYLKYHAPSLNLLNGHEAPAEIDWCAVVAEMG